MPELSRRRYLGSAAAALVLGAARLGRRAAAQSPDGRDGCTLSIGTYSLKGLTLDQAIALVAGIGYDGIEIDARPGTAGAPSSLPPARRAEVRRQLEASGLRLTALMEQITPADDDRAHRADLERLALAMDLSRGLAPDAPPLIQTTLGGGTWDDRKALYRDRLADWAEEGRRRGVVVAIKPHRSGAMSRPEEAAWLIEQLGETPWLRLVYDYSHYAFRGMSPEETVRAASPYLAHVAVKDAVQQGDRVVFALPGEGGDFDYAALLRLLHGAGYRGDVCCEASSMVSGRPDYDPAAAARTCYANMARAFSESGVPRG